MVEDSQEKDELFEWPIDATAEAAIKQRAERVGGQIGEAVSSLLAEIMITILSAKPPQIFQTSPQTTHRPIFQTTALRPDDNAPIGFRR